MTKDILDTQKFVDNGIADLIEKSICTDFVHLSEENEEALANIWKQGSKNITVKGQAGWFCPSDLLFQNTVPLTDLTFVQEGAMVSANYRVHIFPNYKQILDTMFDDDKVENILVGVIEVYIPSLALKNYIGLFCVKESPNIITPSYMGCFGRIDITKQAFEDDEVRLNITMLANNAIGLWYAIQLCLLNPVTKVIFSEPAIKKLHGKEKVDMQKRDKTVKYVKHYYVKDEDIDNVIYGGDRSYNRKCLIWYVTGHWREYSNGRRTFVKGYFKGVLRNTPTADVSRIREIEWEGANENV